MLRQKSFSCIRLEGAAGPLRGLSSLDPSQVTQESQEQRWRVMHSRRTERVKVFTAAFLRKVNLEFMGDLTL